MNKVVVSVLALAFLVSASGCADKIKYDKLLKEKVSIAKECAQLTQENADLKSQVTMPQKVKEGIVKLIQENARLKSMNLMLQKEKEGLAQQLKEGGAKEVEVKSETIQQQ